MRQQIIKLILPTFLFAFSTTIFSQNDNSGLKQLIKKTNDQFVSAMMAKDNAAMLSLYTDDIISLPSYHKMIKGKKAMAEMMEKDKSNPNKVTDFSLTTTDVIPSGNLVLEIGKYALTVEMKGMDKPWKDVGKYLNVFEKQNDGSLKLKADIWNSDINPLEMMNKGKHQGKHKMMEKESGKHKHLEE